MTAARRTPGSDTHQDQRTGAASEYYRDEQVTLWLGDALDVLRGMPDASVDAIVTDPPYGLEFMGKDWDRPWAISPANTVGYAGREDLTLPTHGDSRNANCRTCGGRQRGARRCTCPAPAWDRPPAADMREFQAWCERWAAECLRVLKPGGHLLAFGAPRTYHRLASGIEDAGFEIRDSINCAMGMLAWYYGSGFPKSKAVSRDAAFCQCLPPVRDAAAEEATESAAEVLLADLRRAGQANARHAEDLHGLSVRVHPDYAPPGGTEQDVLPEVRSESDRRGEQESRASALNVAGDEGRDSDLLGVRDRVQAGDGLAQGRQGADVFPRVQRESAGTRVGDTRPQGASGLVGGDGRALAQGDARALEPGLEGRGDVQATEGELHRPEVRTLPAGLADDGEVGRLHHGTPPGHGPLDRPSATADGGREPQGSRPAEQRQVELGAVSVERGSQARRGWPVCRGCGKPQIPAGLGTALKPAWEPIVMARKPFAGTVAANVLEHGAGALNIDACRTANGAPKQDRGERKRLKPGAQIVREGGSWSQQDAAAPRMRSEFVADRWPTNLLLTHAPLLGANGEILGDACAGGCVPCCPVAEMDRQSGATVSSGGAGSTSGKAGQNAYGTYSGTSAGCNAGGLGDSGGASRFFPVFRYEAKAPAAERPRLEDGTAHTTVKPLELMRWLVRLVTPPGGTVFDPFAGSGTTLEAALIEGFHAGGSEREPQYAALCAARLSKPIQPSLFGDLGAAS